MGSEAFKLKKKDRKKIFDRSSQNHVTEYPPWREIVIHAQLVIFNDSLDVVHITVLTKSILLIIRGWNY